MSDYLSNRKRNLNIGISSYTENHLVLDVIGNTNISGVTTIGTVQISSGIITATSGVVTYYGDGSKLKNINISSAAFAESAGIATYATELQNTRTFEITGDIVAPPQNFNGTGNVSLAATIQPNSVGLGTHTYGDYVKNITGTIGEIEVSVTSGEGASPQIGLPNNVTITNNLTVGQDVQINRNLNVTGNITIGGTAAYVIVNDFRVKDADIVTGFTTNSFGNDVSTDITANHGGIAVASTEGTPLISIYNPAIGENTPATYKKIMWFKSGSFAGLNTDAWLINYAVGIGSTQIPNGVRLAVSDVQITDFDISKVRNINSSGIITAVSFYGDGSKLTNINASAIVGVSSYAETSGIATNVIGGIASVTSLRVSGISTLGTVQISSGIITATSGVVTYYGDGSKLTNISASAIVGVSSYAETSGIATVAQGLTGTPNIRVGVVTASSFIGNLTGTATTANNLSDAANITTGTINSARLSGFYGINVSYANTAGVATVAQGLTGTPDINVGIITAASFIGNLTGTATTATNLSNAANITTGTISSARLSGFYGINVSYANTAGISTVAQGLTGTPNINVGIATASSFIGNLTGTATTANNLSDAANITTGTISSARLSGDYNINVSYSNNSGISSNVIGGIGSISQLLVTGISTFINGPILIGSATSTGTGNQKLQVTGDAYVSGSLGIGTTTPINNSGINIYKNTYPQLALTQNLSSNIIAGFKFIVGPNNDLILYRYYNGFDTVLFTIDNGGNIYPPSGNNRDIGASSTPWNNIYLNKIFIGTGTSISSPGSNILSLGTNNNEAIRINSTNNVGIGTTNPSSKLYVNGDGFFTGILTASSFSGNATTAGYAQTAGIATVAQGLTGTPNINVGIATASSFIGNLTGTATTANNLSDAANITTGTISSARLSGFYGINVSYANTTGIASYANSSGVSTDVIGGIASVTSLRVSGISTLGTVQISSGIITATSGVVTYYGDGSKLTGINASSISGTISTAFNVIGGIASVTSLSVSGISTLDNIQISSGIITATTGVVTYYGDGSKLTNLNSGSISGTIQYAANSGIASALQNSRTFQITGDVLASPVSFDGTGNVSLAATIQPNSVALGSDTTGDYVQTISGTANQITVTGGTGEGSTPTVSIAPNPTIPGNVTIANDLQVNNNLNVTGNITIGGTTAFITVNDFRVKDADIITGFTTDSNGNDVSNDTTANHGGLSVASTVGNPLVQIYNPAIGEITPATYKKIMWFKSGSFAGLNTDAWLINYAVGIGSTQFPTGTRLAAGSVQFTENDLAVVRNINASGVITASSFVGSGSNLTGLNATSIVGTVSTATNVIGGIASVTSLSVSGISTLGIVTSGDIFSTGVITATSFTGSLSGTATTANNLSDAANITTGTINSARLSGFYSINVSYANTAGIATVAQGLTGTPSISVSNLNVSGISTLGIVTSGDIFSTGVITATSFVGSGSGLTQLSASSIVGTVSTATNVIGGIASATSLSVSGISTLGTVQISSGIITATSGVVTYYGDGSKLQGINASGAISISNNITNSNQLIPYTISFGSTTGLGASNNFVFNPSTGNLGIGTTNPTSQLYVVGDTYITGILTANRIVSSVYGEFTGGSISGSNIVGTSLSISGISTLGIVTSGDIFSTGVITATSFTGSLSGTATTANNLSDAANITTGTINSARLSGFYGINVSYANTSGIATVAQGLTDTPSISITNLNVSGVSTLGTVQISSGIITATAGVVTYYGDGSKLSSVVANINVVNDTTTNATRYITFEDVTSGQSSSVGVSSTKLTFNPSTGTLSATVFTSLSDKSQKTNIEPIQNPIEITKQLTGVKFKWKDNHINSLGLIAQDVEKVLPEVVNTDENGIKSVNYGSLIGLLVETIKEQQIRIEILEEKLNA